MTDNKVVHIGNFPKATSAVAVVNPAEGYNIGYFASIGLSIVAIEYYEYVTSITAFDLLSAGDIVTKSIPKFKTTEHVGDITEDERDILTKALGVIIKDRQYIPVTP